MHLVMPWQALGNALALRHALEATFFALALDLALEATCLATLFANAAGISPNTCHERRRCLGQAPLHRYRHGRKQQRIQTECCCERFR